MSAEEAIKYLASQVPDERKRPAVEAVLTDVFKAAGGVIARGEPAQMGEPRATVKAASRAMLAARKRGPRGPRVKPNPRLPENAPEIYKNRERREELGWKKEHVIQFVERVYAPWRDILTRVDLRRLDWTADTAVGNWISAGKPLPEGLLLTESELNTAKRQQLEPRGKRHQRFARMLRGAAPPV